MCTPYIFCVDLPVFNDELKVTQIVGAYFTAPDCNVCESVRPEIIKQFETLPDTNLIFVDCTESPDISGQYLVFTVPTLILFLEGKEFQRFSRFMRLGEVNATLEKMMNLLTTDDESISSSIET